MSDENQTELPKVKCPTCKKLTLYAPENPFRPFCSERCRLLDLGNWASENYRVATEEAPNMEIPEIPETDVLISLVILGS